MTRWYMPRMYSRKTYQVTPTYGHRGLDLPMPIAVTQRMISFSVQNSPAMWNKTIWLRLISGKFRLTAMYLGHLFEFSCPVRYLKKPFVSSFTLFGTSRAGFRAKLVSSGMLHEPETVWQREKKVSKRCQFHLHGNVFVLDFSQPRVDFKLFNERSYETTVRFLHRAVSFSCYADLRLSKLL